MYKEIKKEDIEKEYSNKVGVSGRVAAKKLGLSYKTFKNKLEENSIPFKKRNSKYEILNNKEWLRNEYINNKKSVNIIAQQIGCSKGVVHSALKWAKIDRRTSLNGLSIKFPEGRVGENSSNWKGGRRVGGEKGRYVMLLRPEHPNADSSGYVMEHRLVMEDNEGRYLTKDEIVHHLDGNGHNNDISNLQLTTRKKHFQDHFDAVKYVKGLELEVERLKKLLSDNNLAF